MIDGKSNYFPQYHIESIVSEEKLFHITITGANVEKQNKTSLSSGRIWGSNSILRLIHVEEDDKIMGVFAQKHAADYR